LNLLIYWK